MSRNALTTAIALVLLVYGLYILSYALPMLVSAPPISMLVGFWAQTIAALVAAAGVWWYRPWAAVAILVLGAAIAVTAIIEGFVLGLVGYNHAVAVAVGGLLLAIFAAIYVSRGQVGTRLTPA